MLVMRTIEDPAHPVCELVCPEQTIRLDDLPLSMYPSRLDGVQPRTLLREMTAHDPHPTAALFDLPVVGAEPPPHLFGEMPTGLSQMRSRNFLPLSSSFSKLHSRNRVVMEETGLPSTNLSHVSYRIREVESVAGDGLRLGVVLGDRPLERRRGSPSSLQVLRVGSASRLHQHSSSKPVATRDSPRRSPSTGR